MWAGLNLTADDVPSRPTGEPSFPIEFMKAVTSVWQFAGLRNNEICRLRRGCVRWDEVDIVSHEAVQRESEYACGGAIAEDRASVRQAGRCRCR